MGRRCWYIVRDNRKLGMRQGRSMLGWARVAAVRVSRSGSCQAACWNLARKTRQSSRGDCSRWDCSESDQPFLASIHGLWVERNDNRQVLGPRKSNQPPGGARHASSLAQGGAHRSETNAVRAGPFLGLVANFLTMVGSRRPSVNAE